MVFTFSDIILEIISQVFLSLCSEKNVENGAEFDKWKCLK